MEDLKLEQYQCVNGGVVSFLMGYAAGKALDYVISGQALEDGKDWSQNDFSESNEYFLNNRSQFNSLI